jgi:hypothetical protein
MVKVIPLDLITVPEKGNLARFLQQVSGQRGRFPLGKRDTQLLRQFIQLDPSAHDVVSFGHLAHSLSSSDE